MGTCLTKIKHEACGGSGLQVFEREDGSVDGFCFSCGEYVRHPYGEEKEAKSFPKPKKKTKKEVEAELKEITGYQTVSIPSRKLRKDVLEDFGVKVALSEQDGKTPTHVHFPYRKDGKITGYKVRSLQGKKIWSVGSLSEVDLFGWDEAVASAARRLIITEGEYDAVALKRIIDQHTPEKYKDYKPAVVSLQHGIGSVKNNLPKIVSKINKHFKEVALCFDNDKPGKEAIAEAMKHLPDAMVINLPEQVKDANDCILEGLQAAAYKAIKWDAQKPKTSRLVFAEDLHEDARKPAEWGQLSWPWPKLQNVTRGIRLGETIYIGAGVKMGKSELVNTLGAHFIKEDGVKIFMAKPEEVNLKSYKLLCGKIAGKVFHDPEVEFDEKAYDEAGKIIKGNAVLVDLYQNITWESLQQDIRDAAAWGAKAIFIDPITNLTDGMSASATNEKLQEICLTLSSMAKDLDLVIFIFCHLKAPDNNLSLDQRQKKYKAGKYIGLGNCDHSMGGTVLSSQFAGSRAMIQKCNMCLGLEGNKDPELEDIKPSILNTRNLKLIEEREFGQTAIVPLFWNKNTTLFEEI